MQTFQTILVALIGGGFVGFLQFLITRHDNKEDKDSEVLEAINLLGKRIETLEGKIDSVDAKGDERGAVDARVRILRFEDDLQDGRRPSRERFNQCLVDITSYTNYSATHPNFANDQTAETIAHIRRVYQDRLDKCDF